MNKQEAIHATHTNIVTVRGDDAFDIDGNLVQYNEATVQAYMDANAYKAKRIAEYPPITDYLDGIVKGDQTQIDKYIADCLAVKAKYPKVTT
jgi:hypothetical protein